MVKLIFPQEIEVWYVLPAIRKKIALKLMEKNISQKKVAEMMSVTPSAVCQYKSQKRAKEEIFDAEMEKELETSVINIVEEKTSLASEIIRLNNLMKKKGVVCKIYHKICALSGDKKNCLYCKSHK